MFTFRLLAVTLFDVLSMSYSGENSATLRNWFKLNAFIYRLQIVQGRNDEPDWVRTSNG